MNQTLLEQFVDLKFVIIIISSCRGAYVGDRLGQFTF